MDEFNTQKMGIVLLTLFIVCAADLYLLRQPTFDNLFVDVNTLETIEKVPTLVYCAYTCVTNKGCVSVFYDKISKSCILKSVLFMEPNDGVFQSGTKYYSVYEDGCPKDYIRNRKYDLCYKPFFETVEWIYDAMRNCALMENVLLRANSVDAYRHVSDQLMVTPVGDGYGYYIDGSDDINEGHWIFADGNNMTGFIWGYDEPDNYTDSDFIYLKQVNGEYIMSDTQSELYGDYICQKLMNEEEEDTQAVVLAGL